MSQVGKMAMVQAMVESFSAGIQHYRAQLKSVFEGRKIILIGGSVAALTDMARQLRGLGAERPFIIGSSLGTGALPTEEDAEWVSLEVRASGTNEAFRVYENLLSHLPEEVRQRLDQYDPKRAAIAVGSIILGDVPQVGGRPRYGARPRSWASLEDKIVIDVFWDSIAVARAPSAVVRPDFSVLDAAAKGLDQGRGTVWVGDAREGVHGGAEGLRWVTTAEQALEAVDFFSTRCDRVRVTPFLEGIPCSIHGLVLPDGISVFRPVELVTLRRHESSRFLYAGLATYWDPDPSDRELMRDVAERTAQALAERVGFRGPFTVDGVMTEQGFLPTELNPRIGTGLSVLEAATQGLPLVLLALAAQAGQTLDFRPDELEELVVHAADQHRTGGGWTVIPKLQDTTRRFSLVEDGGSYRFASDSEPRDAELALGPSDAGGCMRYLPEPGRIQAGGSIAPRVVSAFSLADREFALGLGPLDHAVSCR